MERSLNKGITKIQTYSTSELEYIPDPGILCYSEVCSGVLVGVTRILDRRDVTLATPREGEIGNEARRFRVGVWIGVAKILSSLDSRFPISESTHCRFDSCTVSGIRVA